MSRRFDKSGDLDKGASGPRTVGLVMLCALSSLLCFGCAGAPLARPVETRVLLIENPGEQPLVLERVGGSRVELGRDQHHTLTLEADRYVIHAGGLSQPAALLAGVVGEDESTRVVIEKAVETETGFVYIPGGPTLVGDVLGVGAMDERPARLVEIEAFLLADHETTNAEYADFLNDVRSCDEDWLDLGGPKCGVRRDAQGRFVTDAPDLPVVTVSYFGAEAYCRWKSGTGTGHYRLPTEEEWERAARGPETATYSYGDVFELSAANQESGLLRPVRSYPANAWGLYDCTGNAFEWTSSDYVQDMKVLRGGSYVLDGPYLRCSFRMRYRPLVQADDIGFRVLKEIPR